MGRADAAVIRYQISKAEPCNKHPGELCVMERSVVEEDRMRPMPHAPDRAAWAGFRHPVPLRKPRPVKTPYRVFPRPTRAASRRTPPELRR